MKQLTINLNDIQECIRTKSRVNNYTHDLALYLMLNYNLFRTDRNIPLILSSQQTLERVDLRFIINEEIAPVQADKTLVTNVTSYFKSLGDLSIINNYNLVQSKPKEHNYSYKTIEKHDKISRYIEEELTRLDSIAEKVEIVLIT